MSFQGQKPAREEKKPAIATYCGEFSKMSYSESKTKFGDSPNWSCSPSRASGVPCSCESYLTRRGMMGSQEGGGNWETCLSDLLAELSFPPMSKSELEWTLWMLRIMEMGSLDGGDWETCFSDLLVELSFPPKSKTEVEWTLWMLWIMGKGKLMFAT